MVVMATITVVRTSKERKTIAKDVYKRQSPVLVGGARVFGPKPRDYWFKLNKKVKTLARKSALSYKAWHVSIWLSRLP